VALVGTRDLDEPEADYVRHQQLTLLDVATLSGAPAALAGLPPSAPPSTSTSTWTSSTRSRCRLSPCPRRAG
jgi:hypothetical protein